MLAFEANSIILGRRDANPENTGAAVRGEREKAVAAEAGVQINVNIKKKVETILKLHVWCSRLMHNPKTLKWNATFSSGVS